MNNLAQENERLRREINESKHLAGKLVKENTSLKVGNRDDDEDDDEEFSESARTDLDLEHLITKLERNITLNSSDDKDTDLEPTLHMFYDTLREKHNHFTDQVKEIINPCTQAKISLLDAEIVTPLDNGMTETDDGWWEQFSKDAKITEDQAGKIKEVRRDHYLEFHRLRAARRELYKDIREFYKDKFYNLSSQMVGGGNSSSVRKSEPVEMADIAELAAKLEGLKANLDQEKTLILDTHKAMSKILTPKQEALLVTRSFHKVKQSSSHTLQMLDNIWDVVSRKDGILEKCCGPEWKEWGNM